jgi:1-phosphofructokinase family hexose kinase
VSGSKYILILSLNAAVDRIISVPRLEVGKAHRTSETLDQAGGKGINVARALTALGHNVFVLGFAGGITGDEIRSELHDSRIPFSLIPISGRSRNCYIVVDCSSGRQTQLNEPGPEITAEEYEQFYSELLKRLEYAQLLICSGSLPRGIDPGCYGNFTQLASSLGLRTLVDASGEALRLALDARPFLVKPNRDEAEQLLGMEIDDDGGIEAARRIRARGASLGLVSLGEIGAAAAWDGGEILVRAPSISVVNAVASGDAFLAGCVTALLSDASPPDMIRWGVAAGSANAMVGGARITRAEVERLRAEIGD